MRVQYETCVYLHLHVIYTNIYTAFARAHERENSYIKAYTNIDEHILINVNLFIHIIYIKQKLFNFLYIQQRLITFLSLPYPRTQPYTLFPTHTSTSSLALIRLDSHLQSHTLT